MVHCNASIEAASSRRIVLKAVVTTSASSATINDASEVSASTQVFIVFSFGSFMTASSDFLYWQAAVI
jgi:hypothetical protein